MTPVACAAALVLVLASADIPPLASTAAGQGSTSSGPPELPAQAPWVGTWEQDFERSTRRDGPAPYKRVTLRIEPAGDGLAVIYDMVGVRGGVTHLEWTGRFDGRDYPVQGVDYVLTNAYRRIDDRRYEIVVKVDGEVAATARVTVSPDGALLTVETAERDQEGTVVNTRAVYVRRVKT